MSASDHAPRPILLAWSGGKDCMMALARLRADPARWRIAGLVTMITDGDPPRVAAQGIRRNVLRAQAAALGLNLLECDLPPQPSNATYEAAFAAVLAQARTNDPALVTIAFGDLLLEDVRVWREGLLKRLGWRCEFPLWRASTARLARQFIADGYRAVLSSVDTQQLDAHFADRAFDTDLLADLPDQVDPCGENGEFHTLCHDGPLFRHPLAIERVVTFMQDERFCVADFRLC